MSIDPFNVHVRAIGITGSRKGISLAQETVFLELLDLYPFADELHHGDCVGADERANGIALKRGLRVISHPPLDPRLRAFCQGPHEERPPVPFLERNRHIVLETDILIALPKELSEQVRSGTWFTVRYAIKNGGPIHIVYPNGHLENRMGL